MLTDESLEIRFLERHEDIIEFFLITKKKIALERYINNKTFLISKDFYF